MVTIQLGFQVTSQPAYSGYVRPSYKTGVDYCVNIMFTRHKYLGVTESHTRLLYYVTTEVFK